MLHISQPFTVCEMALDRLFLGEKQCIMDAIAHIAGTREMI
jgi:hypothetical protein